jgi:hypothetical protein
MKINVDKNQLNSLLDKFTQWKEEYSQLLQQYDVKLQHSRDKQAILNSEQVSLFIFFLFIKYIYLVK